MAVTRLRIVTPKTCPTLEAGSVLTSKTRCPAAARRTEVAQAMEVFPTPPLPVKNRNRGGWSRNLTRGPNQQGPPPQQLDAFFDESVGAAIPVQRPSSARLG